MPTRMDEPVISIFDESYYSNAIFGAIVFLSLTGYAAYCCLFYHLLSPGKAWLILAALIGFDYLYYYLFSKSWKVVTVTAEEVIIYYVVYRKQINIPFAEITRVSTYRTQSEDGARYSFSQDFVIEYGDDKSVGFNEAWYENYNRLKMTIYFHKYGPGHGRERYLRRHGRRA